MKSLINENGQICVFAKKEKMIRKLTPCTCQLQELLLAAEVVVVQRNEMEVEVRRDQYHSMMQEQQELEEFQREPKE